mgnify:CR=1 FL=1
MDLVDILILSFGILAELIIFAIVIYKLYHTQYQVDFEIVCYVGQKGLGKTTLACVLADLFHRSYEDFVRQFFAPVEQKMLDNGFPNGALPTDTLIYSDTPLFTRVSNQNKDEFVKAYDCDFNKFRVPTENNHKLIDYYPFGAYIIFDEVANKAQARQFANFSSNLAVMLNLTRKFGYNINMMWPELTDADKILRKCCHCIRVLQGCEPIIKHNEMVGFRWHFIDYRGASKFENALNGVSYKGIWRDFHIYNQTKADIQKYTYTFYGDISKICDTRPELLYMLNHFTKWTTRKSPLFDISRKDVKDFVKSHPAFSDNIADVADNRSVAEKRKGIYKTDKE